MAEILQTFRTEGKYSDYPLKVNGEFDFKLHKDIISKKSEYFRSMFNKNFQESTELEVTDKYIGLEKRHFDLVFDYLYGIELKLNEYSYTDLYCIYTIASRFVVESLTETIQKFITTQLSEGMNMYDEINDNFDLFLERIIFYYLLLENTPNKRFVYTLLSACKNFVNEMTDEENEKMNKYIEFNQAMKKILTPETYLEFASNWRQNITMENILNNKKVGECMMLDVFEFGNATYQAGIPSVTRFANPTLIRQSPLEMGDLVFRDRDSFMKDFVDTFSFGVPRLITKYWENIIISGGSVARSVNTALVQRQSPPSSDVDIFVFGKTLEDRKATCEYLVNEVFEKNFPGKCWYTIKRAVMTVTVVGIPRQFQIICTSAQTGYQIMNNFDLTHVQFYYQDGRVLATPDAILSHIYMTTMIKKNSIFASRVYKSLVDGFKMIFPKTYNIFIWNGEKSEKFKFADLGRLTMDYLRTCKNTESESKKFFHPDSTLSTDEIKQGLINAFSIVPEQLTNSPSEALGKLQIRNNFVGDMMLNYGNNDNIMDYKNITLDRVGFGQVNNGKPRAHVNSIPISYAGNNDGIRVSSPLIPFPTHSFSSIIGDYGRGRLKQRYVIYPVFEDKENNPEFLRWCNFWTGFGNVVKDSALANRVEWFGPDGVVTPENNDNMFQNPFKHRYTGLKNTSMKLYLTTKNYDSIDCLFVDTFGNIICNHIDAFNRAKYMEAVIKVNRVWITKFKYGYSFTVEKIILHYNVDPDAVVLSSGSEGNLGNALNMNDTVPDMDEDPDVDSIDDIDQLLN